MGSLFLRKPLIIVMSSSRRAPAATGLMNNRVNPSFSKHIAKAFLLLIGLSFIIQNSYGADDFPSDTGSPGGYASPPPDLSSPEDPATGEQAPSTFLGPTGPGLTQSRRGSGGFPRSLSAFSKPVFPHAFPPSMPSEENAEGGEKREKTHEPPKKKKSLFHRAYKGVKHFGRRLKTGIRKAWESFKAKMLRAKEAARRGIAKLYAEIPKFRRGKPTEPKFFMGPPGLPKFELTSNDEAVLANAPEGCRQWVELLPPQLREVWKMYPQFCALWMLFNRDGLLGANRAQMLQLAMELAEKLNQEKGVTPVRGDTEGLKLKMHKEVANKENGIAEKRYLADKYCWFTDVRKIYARATSTEKDKILSDRGLRTLKANPCKMLLKVPRLVEAFKEDAEKCMVEAEGEVELRRDVARLFTQYITRFSEEGIEGEEEEGHTRLSVKERLAKELKLLNGREKCAMIELDLTQEQVRKMWHYIKEQNERSFLTRWAVKADLCVRQGRDANFLPSFYVTPCKEYLEAPPPTSPAQVLSDLAWLWQAGDTREGQQE